MSTPINARDLSLQQTVPRVLGIASNYITIVSPNLEAKYGADNVPAPATLELTVVMSGSLQGTPYFEVIGLFPNTQLTVVGNKLILNPETFAQDSVVVTAKLDFEGVTYTSVPVTAYKTFSAVTARLSRSFDLVQTDSAGNSYNLPGTNSIELFNGTIKLIPGVTFGPLTQTKSGLTCQVNSVTGQITLSQNGDNTWTSDYETFILTATRNFVAYTVSYTISKVREGGTGIDLTPPPTPTDFAATPAINTVLIQHGQPEYTVGSGHSHTVLYGKEFIEGDILTPFNPAEKIAEFTGNTYTLPSDPGTTWRLWIKWVSKDGGISTVPAGGTNGIEVTTGQNVSKLLDVLTGQITESELYSTLTSRINLIDDPVTGLVKKTDDLTTVFGTTVTAASSAVEANQAKAAAIIAQGLAEGSAVIATEASLLSTSARDAAAISETQASISATQAATSASNAEGSASTATQASLLATSARDAAASSETQASISATQAATSASNAEGSASTATQASLLSTSARDAAASSETQASISATSSAVSASNAAGSASTASTQAGLATQARSDASGFSTAAGISAENAAISETNAAGSATSAATSLTRVQATIRGTSLGLPLEQWVLNGQSIVVVTDGPVGTNALRLSGNYGYPNQGNFVPIDRTRKYRVRFWAKPSSDAAGLLYFSLQQFLDSNGTPGPDNGGRSPYKPSGQNRAQHVATYGDTWGLYNFVWTSDDWQSGVKFVRPDFLDNYSGAAGYWDVQGFTFTDVTDTEELTAAIQTVSNVVSGPEGLSAQYTVKTDVAGHVAGYGLASTSRTSVAVDWAATSTGIIRAATQTAPHSAIFREVFNGRMLGDVTNNGLVNSADASIVNQYGAGLSIDPTIAAYIENVLAVIMLANPTKYAAYLKAGTTTVSEFAILADRFYIAPPSVNQSTAPTTNLYPGYVWVDTSTSPPVTKYYTGTAWSLDPQRFPFIVQTAPTVINDVTVPPGVYIDTAFIRDATITNAKIANLAVDSAKIADLAVTTAKIANLAVDNAKIANLNASKINAGFISADRIEGGSISAAKLSVTSLSAVSADMGTVTAGKMQSTDGKFVIDLTNKFISITV